MNTNEQCVTCAFTKEKIDIAEVDTVIIAGTHRGGKFQCFVLMDKFFELFASNPEVGMEQIPGLTPYKDRRWPKIRFRFDPVRFGSMIERWQGAAEIFNKLMK